MAKFNIEVGAVLNTKDIPSELEKVSAQLSKSDSTKIKYRVDVGDIRTAIKEVNQFNTALGKLKQVRIYDPENGVEFSNSLTKVSEGLKTVYTETEKYGDALGRLVTRTKTVDDANRTLITETQNFVNSAREQITVTRLLDENFKQIGDSVVKVNKFEEELTTTTTQTRGVIHEFGRDISTLVTTTTKVGTNVERLTKVMTEYTDSQGYAVKRLQEFNRLGQQVGTTITTKTKKLNEDTSATNKNTQANNSNTKSAEKSASAHKTLGASFANAFTQLTKFYLASLPLRTITKVITDAADAVKDFDAAITEMGKVTDYSGDSLKRYAEDLGALGDEVARTRTEMVEGATGWLKAGYSEEDAAQLAKYSALLQNTADEQLSAADATSILVSQLKAYHMEANEAIKITDIINKVSAEQAVSSGDIAKGLQQASSSMATFGNSIEQTTALLTGGTTIFQGQSQRVARALNTIAIRVTKNKDELEKYGIVVENTDGSLRSTYDILTDLKPKWDAMTDAERTALGATLAG